MTTLNELKTLVANLAVVSVGETATNFFGESMIITEEDIAAVKMAAAIIDKISLKNEKSYLKSTAQLFWLRYRTRSRWLRLSRLGQYLNQLDEEMDIDSDETVTVEQKIPVLCALGDQQYRLVRKEVKKYKERDLGYLDTLYA